MKKQLILVGVAVLLAVFILGYVLERATHGFTTDDILIIFLLTTALLGVCNIILKFKTMNKFVGKWKSEDSSDVIVFNSDKSCTIRGSTGSYNLIFLFFDQFLMIRFNSGITIIKFDYHFSNRNKNLSLKERGANHKYYFYTKQ